LKVSKVGESLILNHKSIMAFSRWGPPSIGSIFYMVIAGRLPVICAMLANLSLSISPSSIFHWVT